MFAIYRSWPNNFFYLFIVCNHSWLWYIHSFSSDHVPSIAAPQSLPGISRWGQVELWPPFACATPLQQGQSWSRAAHDDAFFFSGPDQSLSKYIRTCLWVHIQHGDIMYVIHDNALLHTCKHAYAHTCAQIYCIGKKKNQNWQTSCACSIHTHTCVHTTYMCTHNITYMCTHFFPYPPLPSACSPFHASAYQEEPPSLPCELRSFLFFLQMLIK